MNGHDAIAVPAAAPPGSSTPAWRLLGTLTLAGAFAGALIALVYQVTLPPIERYAGAKISGAVREVLGAPVRLDTLYLVGDKLTRTAPGDGARNVPRAFVGFDEKGARTGVAVQAAEPGFADLVLLMVGFNPDTRAVTGFVVLGQKETPGLGDKIKRDSSFVSQFHGKVAPLKGAKSESADASTVRTITGATISSRAVIQIINNAVALWQPRVAAFDAGEGQ